jgi:hypothetical protein
MPEGESKVNFERGAAFDDSTQPHPAVRPPTPAPKGSSDRTFLLALALGILIGLALAGIAGIVLYGMGWLGECPPAAGPGTCPPTAIYFLPDCPTNAAGCFLTPTSTETPTPEATAQPAAATPDFAATATQACFEWRSRFPATPCPAFATPTP